jgi:hypothetical protein
MSGKPIKRRLLQRQTVDRAVLAYVGWRAECTAVRNAYRHWVEAPSAEATLAYRGYQSALEREEAAAQVYAGLMRRVGHLVETGLDYPLAATGAPGSGESAPLPPRCHRCLGRGVAGLIVRKCRSCNGSGVLH